MQQPEELKKLLSVPRKIMITTHHKPDGDAMGSSLALYNYLLMGGHTVHVITPTDYPFFLHWMPGNAEVIIFTEKEQESAKIVQEAEIIFCLDFNALSRINKLGELVAASTASKVLIDHHLDPEGFEDYRFWDTNACAAAELVYQFIEIMGDKHKINSKIASCLYAGIMTDSGSFRFPSTTAKVHRIVADLIEAGAENSRIHELVYDNFSELRLRFLGYCIKDKLQVFPEFRTALITLSKEELERYKVGTGDSEGVVNYALSINGIKLAALIIERPDRVKLSLRSKGEFPANEVAKKYFEGGGHRNAAGGQSELSLKDTEEKFKQLLPEYKPLLIQ